MSLDESKRTCSKMYCRIKKFRNFSKEMDYKLIKMISGNEVLYNTRHNLYKDYNARETAWARIASKVGRNGADCKTRWRSLRDLYLKKKKLERRGIMTKSRWQYCDLLTFLDDFISERKLESLMPEPEPEETESNNDNGVNFVSVPMELNRTAHEILYELEDGDNSKRMKVELNEVVTEEAEVEEEPETFGEQEIFEEEDSLTLLREIRDATQNNNQNPIKMFFDSMARTVMGFPPALAAQAKLKVCQIVTEMECQIYDEEFV